MKGIIYIMQIGGRKYMQIMSTKQCSSWNVYCECSILWTHHMVASCVCVRFDAVRAFLTWGPSKIHTKELLYIHTHAEMLIHYHMQTLPFPQLADI